MDDDFDAPLEDFAGYGGAGRAARSPVRIHPAADARSSRYLGRDLRKPA